MTKKPSSVIEVEYEVLDWLLLQVDLKPLEDMLVVDDVSAKRFAKGTANICALVENMKSRRAHRLPKSHSDYNAKED